MRILDRVFRQPAQLFVCLGLVVGAAGCPQPGETTAPDPSGTQVTTTTPPPAPAAAPPQGDWKAATAEDATNAGFETLMLTAGGAWSETGRTDGEPAAGAYTQPGTIDIDPSYGQPPAGMHGPYIDLSNDPNGDGEWAYAWTESSDGSSLTLVLYAERKGMGMRWAGPTAIELVSAK